MMSPRLRLTREVVKVLTELDHAQLGGIQSGGGEPPPAETGGNSGCATVNYKATDAVVVTRGM